MRKIGLIAMALVLALGALGVGFAAWTDTVTVDGDVDTGVLSWEFTVGNFLDVHEPANYGGDFDTTNPDYTCNIGFDGGTFWTLDKDVSWGESSISQDGKTFYLTLHNVYPCNFNKFTFYVHNNGTLPLKVDHVVINGTTFDAIPCDIVYYDWDDNGQNDFEILYGNNFGLQLDPCEGMGVEFSMWFHTLQPCPQGQTFTFELSAVAVQWNEYPLPTP